MVKQRIPETDHGIVGEFNTQIYDDMMRRMRDKGWLETKLIIGSGIRSGLALEIGPGPGYIGLEWLKNTDGTTLRGMDISEDMLEIARRNAAEYDLTDRVKYVKGDAQKMPFGSNYFDAVFTNGSLHEWSHPEKIMDEIVRVLKPGGRYCISDMKRDMSPLLKWLMYYAMARPKEIRPGLISSINASYTIGEIEAMLPETQLQGYHVTKNLMGIVISGQKPPAAARRPTSRTTPSGPSSRSRGRSK
jgi:ubiquinone/menaquinone biosynthesis C-methylase UbiE